MTVVSSDDLGSWISGSSRRNLPGPTVPATEPPFLFDRDLWSWSFCFLTPISLVGTGEVDADEADVIFEGALAAEAAGFGQDDVASPPNEGGHTTSVRGDDFLGQ